MANGTFFVSWELWQQMTFVLAMGIAFVFFLGLMKLWWTNRHMKKIEELDAEKQVRAAQMRRSGIPASNLRSRLGSEIPFGVKALESGVEVDGVWVARMASMASRPLDRKWSSKRKIKAPVLDVGSRGSIRAGRLTRRDIIKPSAQTGKKLESLPLREGEAQSNGSGAGHRHPVHGMDHEEARSPRQKNKGGQPGHEGPLSRIQRSLKKMTSSELWNDQQKQQFGGQEAIEFRTNAGARKPQRFYPQGATSTAPVRGTASHHSIPQRRSSLCSNSDQGSAATATTSGPTEVSGTQATRHPTTAPRSHEPRHQASRASSVSSADSFDTSMEELKEFAPRPRPPPLEHHPVFSSGDATQASELTFGRRRSRRSSPQNGHARRSSSEDRSTIHDQQQPQHDAASQSGPATALRYPPNSSRSAAYIQQPRPQSFASDHHQQQQQRPGGSGGASSSAAQPSPTFGPSDSYINTSTRKVNPNFEVLPAGTFGLPELHAPEEPASTAASARSSFESQKSGRRKLQKKRTSSSHSKQGH